jgi:hypothetical protein
MPTHALLRNTASHAYPDRITTGASHLPKTSTRPRLRKSAHAHTHAHARDAVFLRFTCVIFAMYLLIFVFYIF